MNGIEVVLTKGAKRILLQTGEVEFSYLGCLYKVKYNSRSDLYRLYRYNPRRTASEPKEWWFLMNIEEPIVVA